MRGARVPLENLHFHVMILLFTAANAGPSRKSRNENLTQSDDKFFKTVWTKKWKLLKDI